MRSEFIPYHFKTFILCLLLLSLFRGVYGAGLVTGDFLLVNIQARETALGGIFSPYYARSGAAMINPACMQGIKNNFLMFSHYTSVFSSHYEQIEYAQPIDLSSTVSAAFLYSANDELYRTDAQGNPVEKIDNYDSIIGMAYARALNDEYNVGVNLKLISSKVANNADWGAAMNLGLLYRNYENRYTLGADIENVGISTAYFKDKSLYPMLLRAGYGADLYRLEDEYKITLYVEERLYLVEDDGTETSFGLEAAYRKFFVFRYGYIVGKSEGKAAVGAGVRLSDLYIDYAYQPYFISDNAHRVTIRYAF
jgi:hypothetical protein